jgi:plastocyanin
MKTLGTIKILITAVLCAAMATYSGCSEVGDGAAKDSKKDTAAVSNKGDASTAGTEQPAKGAVRIVIENFVFVPAEVTVAPGTKVTWINKDEAPHTATSVDKKFNSGGLDTDDKFSFVFNEKGEYPYFCALHPHMTATITVK